MRTRNFSIVPALPGFIALLAVPVGGAGIVPHKAPVMAWKFDYKTGAVAPLTLTPQHGALAVIRPTGEVVATRSHVYPNESAWREAFEAMLEEGEVAADE